MWIKRTEEEVIKARRHAKRKRVIWSVIAGLFFWLIATFIYIEKRRYHLSLFVSWKDMPARSLALLPVSLLIGWGVHYSQRNPPRIMICPRCEITKNADSELDCPCGGRFEDLETMKWV